MERTVLLLSISLSLALPALPEPQTMPETARDLETFCRELDSEEVDDPELELNQGFCLGYVGGLFQANRIITALGGRPLFCPPEGTTPGQIRQVFLKTMEDNPEMLAEDAEKVMMASLAAAYPCDDPP